MHKGHSGMPPKAATILKGNGSRFVVFQDYDRPPNEDGIADNPIEILDPETGNQSYLNGEGFFFLTIDMTRLN
jgi:hypothetical protein